MLSGRGKPAGHPFGTHPSTPGVSMNDRIQPLLNQMAALEDELREALREQETSLLFEIRGKRVEFEDSIKQAHRLPNTRVFHWLVTDRPQNLITGPLIYSMIVPLLMRMKSWPGPSSIFVRSSMRAEFLARMPAIVYSLTMGRPQNTRPGLKHIASHWVR